MEAQMTARFKAKLAARQPVVVMNPDYPSASLVEFVARLGVDAVMIDTEQGSPDVESVEEMARAARAAGLCALVRIFSPDPWVIERYMLRGVHGIVVPRLDSAAAARRVVEDVHYCFPGNAEEKVVVVQIETANAVAELDRFLAIEGIDCLFIGSVDLAKSLGHQGDFRKPEVMAVLEQTLARIAAAGKPAGMMVKEDDVGHWRSKGATFLYNHLNDYALIGARRFNALVDEPATGPGAIR
jgi:2-keto-3-deoxy-L-rhamnonate aldolase RhmA